MFIECVVLLGRGACAKLFCQIWVRIGRKYGKTPYALACNCGYLKAMRMVMNCELLLQVRAVGWVRSLK
jgi:hypothetical protein